MERAENTARMLDVNYQTVAAAAVRRRGRARLARPAEHQRADAATTPSGYGEVDADRA